MSRSPSGRRAALPGILLAAVALLTACSGGSPSPRPADVSPTPGGSSPLSPAASSTGSIAPSTAPSTEPTEDLGPFACILPVEGLGSTDRAQITDVRVGEHDGFDRIAFEFDGGIPAFRIAAASPPFTQDASGLPLEVEGTAFWQVRLDGGTKVSPAGVVTYDGPTTFAPGFTTLVHLVEGGDFEAISTWYVGMAEAGCIRVLTLSGPPRLVIDIEH